MSYFNHGKFYSGRFASGDFSVINRLDPLSLNPYLLTKPKDTGVPTNDPVSLLPDASSGGLDLEQIVNDDYRPTQTAYGQQYDGVDDYLEVVFSGGTLPTSCSVFSMVNTSDGSFILFGGHDGGRFIGCGSASTSDTMGSNGGSMYVDGVLAANREDLSAAVAVGDWVLVEARATNLTTWEAFGISNYFGGGFRLSGTVGPVLIVDTDVADEHRSRIEAWLRAEVRD